MPAQETIGKWRGTALKVAAWDGTRAEVDLSCACMFAQERGGAAPTGGLAHLDAALGGALTALRREGHFRGEPMELLLLDRPPSGIAARAVLVIGVGDPRTWMAARTAGAAAAAARTAMQRGAGSAAFAPSLLDSGLDSSATGDVAGLMLAAVIAAIDAQAQVAALGLASPPSLGRWVFDVGAAHFEATAERFRAAFAALPPACHT